MPDTLTELLSPLPECFAERTRILHDGLPRVNGDCVVYWLRFAMRADENPALEIAIDLANRLQRPLLVCCVIPADAKFASDRHHTFVLEAVEDLSAQLADRGIHLAVHVERPSSPGLPLPEICGRAAVCVTEDMPVDFSPIDPEELFSSTKTPAVSVDTACVVPMLRVRKAYFRAFEFRNATTRLYDERLFQEWPKFTLEDTTAITDLPFEPVDFSERSLLDLVAECEIDHTIGPVPHTPGGSSAGYARWQNFCENGLARYDKTRNDPLREGNSRMSAYLHYGMVSPFRIAREAAESKVPGAEKYLDELLIWRELAYAFCFYQSDWGTLKAIPKWARDTLIKHAADPRSELYTWETMARGETGDALWDAAQKSLLIQGELHNNVRMTWGKAILDWTPDPQTALTRILDLNHRYALDGQDPASYGGILWCLGQFDRPFPPEKPILGTIRDRATKVHAKRLDANIYRDFVTQPLTDPMPRVAVVGAGLSGLICARTLQDHGIPVVVFEKSRGLGGRMATRRTDTELQFDHGAQYFAARDLRFQRYVESWVEQGLVTEWLGEIVTLNNGSSESKEKTTTRYVAVPGMSALGKHIGNNLDVRLSTRVAAPIRAGEQWELQDVEGNSLGRFDVVILTAPAPQTAELLSAVPELQERVAQVKMTGCYAAMLAFSSPLGIAWDGAFVEDSPISWMARNSSKPGRNTLPETWVVHASAEWSESRLDQEPEEILPLLQEAFSGAIGREPQEPDTAMIHRWRYAIPPEPLSSRCLFDADHAVGVCGDWCSGPRVEGAFLNGAAMAGRILGQLARLPATPQPKAGQLF